MPPSIKVSCCLVFLSLWGCAQKTFDSEEELVGYLKEAEGEYFWDKTINGVNYQLLYLPTDLMVERSGGNAGKTDSLQSKYERYLYFDLSLSKNNRELLTGLASNKKKFGNTVNQLAFGMEDKVYLTSNKDTVYSSDYHYSRMYETTGANSIIFAFERQEVFLENQKDIFLTVEDFGFSTGDTRFRMKVDNLKREPKLTFDNIKN